MKIKKSLLPVLLLIMTFLLFNCRTEISSKSDNPVQKSEGEQSPTGNDMITPNPVLEDNLRKSAMEGNIASVEYLLSRNTRVNATDPDGRTALMLASFNGHTAIARTLIGRGAPVDVVDSAGRTALIYAATGPNTETVQLLLDNGADPDIADTEEGFTALMFAASEGHIEVVKVLLANKADPHLRDKDNDTAESFARKNGHNEIAELLHKHTR